MRTRQRLSAGARCDRCFEANPRLRQLLVPTWHVLPVAKDDAAEVALESAIPPTLWEAMKSSQDSSESDRAHPRVGQIRPRLAEIAPELTNVRQLKRFRIDLKPMSKNRTRPDTNSGPWQCAPGAVRRRGSTSSTLQEKPPGHLRRKSWTVSLTPPLTSPPAGLSGAPQEV